jgi:hypothetical protein
MPPDHGGIEEKAAGLFMIRLAALDPARPVYLLNEKEPGQRMGERHPGERKPKIAPGQDFGGKAKISANHEHNLVLPSQLPDPEGIGQILT